MATTKLVFEAGIRTPRDFAAFMERTFPGGGSRPYVAGIWQIMGGMKRELRTDTIPDWRAIYEGIDKPATSPDNANDETQPSVRRRKSTPLQLPQEDEQRGTGDSGVEADLMRALSQRSHGFTKR